MCVTKANDNLGRWKIVYETLSEQNIISEQLNYLNKLEN